MAVPNPVTVVPLTSTACGSVLVATPVPAGVVAVLLNVDPATVTVPPVTLSGVTDDVVVTVTPVRDVGPDELRIPVLANPLTVSACMSASRGPTPRRSTGR